MMSVLIAVLYFVAGYNTHKVRTLKRKQAMRNHPSWGLTK